MKKIFIVAGEASGDLHASRLVREIKSCEPSVVFMGIGGQNMSLAGVRVFYRADELAIVGVWDIFKHFKKIKEMFFLFLKEVDKEKPDIVILVDYPGFNLRLLKELKKRKVKIIYYISPQLWAWGKNRIYTIKKYVDKMLVFFDFEGELYKKYGVPVECVGHPLLDIAKPSIGKDAVFEELHFNPEKKTIILLPGSRESEINALLPMMLSAALKIHNLREDIQVILVRSQAIAPEIFDTHLRGFDLPCRIAENRGTELYDYLSIADLALVSSGTATLECAIMDVPMVIVYKISLLNAILMKPFIRVPHIGLVNILPKKKIVPELIQFDATPNKIYEEALKILTNPSVSGAIRKDLDALRRSLGSEGASRRAAKAVIKLIGVRP
ncbi:MAG: lipid-A-disaccharide synthase [Candidatus Omnitrophica bacterium]|nr:lipid-A-disaccharide synthase [Candidatus Omnitrophota bacterium]MBU4488246.1 lipid-A-disaccharide synthase [Candidatus Omnitrophota bacterium]MCG2704694.1 lipid-A-disaccharide synthase [Candidatus Omnitrophota bacterium]